MFTSIISSVAGEIESKKQYKEYVRACGKVGITPRERFKPPTPVYNKEADTPILMAIAFAFGLSL